jgi:AraC-like DNA-binding protein
VEQIFRFEGSGFLPNHDLKLIVPNARVKLVVPLRNGLIGKVGNHHHVSKTNKITLIGIADLPGEVDIESDEPAENITVEFSPIGAYRFFRLNWAELKNQIFNLSDIRTVATLRLEAVIANAESFQQKLALIIQFLLQTFRESEPDQIFDYCVEKISSSKGRVTIKELEKQTGYSSRWLNMKFENNIGISPKNLASIIRFQQYYKAYATNALCFIQQKEFYNYYYDQSHFIKDFKRFTGFPPLKFTQHQNLYDQLFYKVG